MVTCCLLVQGVAPDVLGDTLGDPATKYSSVLAVVAVSLVMPLLVWAERRTAVVRTCGSPWP
ncbi:hypothetical protein [Micromonospora sp. NPDC093277]|uniref:hypothetical protein n=1 Tax=Micromonospora sp. NPDC093277 TaxID=3364291 RepID=UPI0038071DF8